MFLMYKDISIVEFTEICDHEYIAYGYFKENNEFKKYKDKLKMDDLNVSISKNSKKYNISIEEIYNGEIEFTWTDENPFLIKTDEYINNEKYNKNIDFSKIEEILKFSLNEDLKEFYKKTDFCKLCGFLHGNQIPETETWGSWFDEDVNVTLLGLDNEENDENIEKFIKSKYEDWTGGYDFGHRIWIGNLEDNRGNILIVFNNDNGNVEWIDSEYGCFGNLNEDPNGILSSSIDELVNILDKNIKSIN